MHNSLLALREIEPLFDTLWLDTKFVELFPVGDSSVSREKQGERKGELEGEMPSWSVRGSHGEIVGSGREVEKGIIVDGVSLVMTAQGGQVQRFLLLGISSSEPAAYERLSGLLQGH
ncbi:hypothetical protein CHU98_g6473 [Xylaria longipes]|nr:hypothetical protein CHU98_g6473 [Xylaria longipes]